MWKASPTWEIREFKRCHRVLLLGASPEVAEGAWRVDGNAPFLTQEARHYMFFISFEYFYAKVARSIKKEGFNLRRERRACTHVLDEKACVRFEFETHKSREYDSLYASISFPSGLRIIVSLK